MIKKLDAIPGIARHRAEVLAAAKSLERLIDWITTDRVEDLVLRRKRGHQVGAAWRYPFFASMRPYLEMLSASGRLGRKEWDWMQQFFTAGDAIKVADADFLRGQRKAGGIKFSDLMKPVFRVAKRKDTGTWETARSWFTTAQTTGDFSLRLHLNAAVEDYFIWRHKLYLRPEPDYDQAPVQFSATDRQYAELAWAMLRDDFGLLQVPDPPASLLARCLNSAVQK